MEELKQFRNYNYKRFARDDGQFQSKIHCGHIHYWDKLNQDNTGVRFREIDTKFIKQPSGWKQTYASYQAIAPEYADEFATFRDLYLNKDRTIQLRAVCDHIQGVQVTDGLHAYRDIEYPNAFGQGIDLIYSAGNNNFQKLVRINENPNLAGDLELQFEIKIPPEELKVDGYTMQDLKNLRLNGKQKITIGSEIANTDNYTYIRPRKVWDNMDNSLEVDIRFEVKGNKVYFYKIITKEFLNNAVYPVYTDTDSSFFSGAGDGNVNTQNQVSWDVAHDDTDGTQASAIDTQTTYPSARKNGVNDFTLGRVFLPIDTSTLPDTDTISSAILYIYYSDVTTVSGNPDGDDITVVESTSASTSTLATTDFDNVGATEYTDTRRTYAEIIAGGDGYYGYTFNSTGISAISKTGYTKLALRCGLDFDDVAPTGVNYLRMKLSEETGTTRDPYLTVTHSSAPATAVKDIIGLGIIPFPR